MENSIKKEGFDLPDCRSAIKAIFDYGVSLLSQADVHLMDIEDYGMNKKQAEERQVLNSQMEYLGERILNHDYILTSVNWLHNLTVDKTFTEEYKSLRLEQDTWSWYATLNMLIAAWLKRKGIWVFDQRIYSTIDVISYWKQFYSVHHPSDGGEYESLDKVFEAAKQEKLGTLFPNTIKHLDEVHDLDPMTSDFIKTSNKHDGVRIPVSFVIDPLFLTITFIH